MKSETNVFSRPLHPAGSDRTGGMGRRGFIGGGLLAGATIAGGILLGAPGKARAETLTPRRGGRIRYAHDSSGPADTFDPVRATSNVDFTRMRTVYNSLFRLNDRLEATPELATEFSVSSDGLTYRFKLREGVEFHDGKPLTAEDVVFSMMLHVGETTTSIVKALVANVAGWSVVDATTVEAKLTTPNIDFPTILATFHFKIVQAGTTDFTKPVGTGPFRVVEFSPGVRSVSQRFENYWGDGPYVDEIEIFSIQDASSRANALISGQVEIIGNVDAQTALLIDAAPGVVLNSLPTASFPALDIRRDRGIGTSVDFRKGIQHLLNREQIVSGVFRGKAVIAGDHPIGSAYGADAADVGIPAFDPDLAKHHFAKAGVEGFAVHVAPINQGMVEICLMLQNEARKIGLPIEVNRVPSDGYWASVWGKEDVTVTRFNMRPAASLFYGLAYATGGAWNKAMWSNERMDQLIRDIPGEKDAALRHEMHREAQTLIQQESGHIIPAFVNNLDAQSEKVQGMTAIPLSPVGGCEWPEFVWLSE